MTESSEVAASPAAKPRMSGLQIFGIVFLAVLTAIGVAFFVISYFFFPGDFRPVQLSAKEQQALSSKLQILGLADLSVGKNRSQAKADKALQPEAYSESAVDREVTFSEKELNALLASNTDLAERLAIDLSEGLVSAKMLVPMDEDLPLVGGKILKLKAGLGLTHENERAVVILKGVSIMGVPLPNAWLGGIKNIDLVQEFGAEQGFWKSFADGIEYLRVEEGYLTVKLEE